jgi:hypothetical protein
MNDIRSMRTSLARAAAFPVAVIALLKLMCDWL